jgi:hypothetical protein
MTIAIGPALSILPERMDSGDARRMLLAVALQETDLAHRRQIRGPARSLWQFERIGVQWILEDDATADYARGLCRVLLYAPEVDVVHAAIEHNDVLAAGFARLLLWQIPDPLPRTLTEGWEQYLRLWRPGRPRRAPWAGNWKKAEAAV